MFRKKYHLWRSLIYIVNMPSESLEDSITGDATAVSSSRCLENRLQQLSHTKQYSEESQEIFPPFFLFNPPLGERVLQALCTGVKINAK